MKFILIPLMFLVGCAFQPVDRYKIISVPVERVKVKKVYKERSCPALPTLSDTASRDELAAHHLRVIRMYKECAK